MTKTLNGLSLILGFVLLMNWYVGFNIVTIDVVWKNVLG